MALMQIAPRYRRLPAVWPRVSSGRHGPGVGNVVPAPRPQGQLLAHGVDDVAALALRLCYQRLEAGEQAAFVQDAVALVRLAWQIERDEAMPGVVRRARERASRVHADQVSIGVQGFAFPCSAGLTAAGHLDEPVSPGSHRAEGPGGVLSWA